MTKYKLAIVASIEGIIKEGNTPQGGKWQLMKVKTDQGDATGLNLKEGKRVLLSYNEQYKNYGASVLSDWQYALFDLLLADRRDKQPDESYESPPPGPTEDDPLEGIEESAPF